MNPVAGNLRDLRAAVQRSGSLTFVQQTIPMAVQYHQCIRDQTVHNRPRGPMIPVIFEEWIWNTSRGLVEEPTYSTNSTAGGSITANTHQYTSADLTGRFPAGTGGVADFSSGTLASINLTGCQGLGQLYLAYNLLDQAAVDGVPTTPPANTGLPTISGEATQGSTLTVAPGTWSGSPTSFAYQWQTSADGVTWADLAGVVSTTKSLGAGDVGKRLRVRVIASNVGGPSAAAFSAATVVITTPPSGAWSWTDDFDRADAVGYAAVGHGWHPNPGGAADASIVNNNLVRTDNAAYQLFITAGDGAAPADYAIEIDLPAWGTGGWSALYFWGVVLRLSETTFSGLRVFFSGGGLTNLVVGNSNSYNADDHVVPTPDFPASWTDMAAPSHTLKVSAVGDQVTITCDGHDVGTITYAMNVGMTGTSFGLLGEGNNRSYHAFRAEAV
jgi:hypothetical protein